MHKQLKEVVGSIKDDEPLMDIVLVHMGSMYSTLKKFEKSTIVYGRAINIMENKYGRFVYGDSETFMLMILFSIDDYLLVFLNYKLLVYLVFNFFFC